MFFKNPVTGKTPNDPASAPEPKETNAGEAESSGFQPPHIFVHSHTAGHTVHIHHHNGQHEKHEHAKGDVEGIKSHIDQHLGGGEESQETPAQEHDEQATGQDLY